MWGGGYLNLPNPTFLSGPYKSHIRVQDKNLKASSCKAGMQLRKNSNSMVLGCTQDTKRIVRPRSWAAKNDWLAKHKSFDSRDESCRVSVLRLLSAADSASTEISCLSVVVVIFLVLSKPHLWLAQVAL